MSKILLLLFLSVLAINAAAQECFRWKNLNLNQSTIAEAIKLLGKPDENRIAKPKFDKINAESDRELINYRKLRYKKFDFYREVELLFLNEKLFSLEFKAERKTVLAADLNRRFNTEFLFAGDLSTFIRFSDYRGRNADAVPRAYPAHYNLVSVDRNCAILAEIDNSSPKTMELFGIKTLPVGMFPGTVRSIQIYSRETKVE